MPDESTASRKFRKKPIVIEAQQWNGTRTEAERLIEWMGGAGRFQPAERETWGVEPPYLFVTTLEDGPNGAAKHVASPNDWIIRGVQGEFYPCKPDIFAATYEPAEAEPTSESTASRIAEIEKRLNVYRDGGMSQLSFLDDATEDIAFLLKLAKPEPDGWVAVSERLPTEGEESRVPLWLGNLKYPHRPHVVYGYYEAGRWWSQWGELKGDEIPTLWYRLPLPVLPEGEKA